MEKKILNKSENFPTVSESSTISDPILGIPASYKYRASGMDSIMDWGIGTGL